MTCRCCGKRLGLLDRLRSSHYCSRECRRLDQEEGERLNLEAVARLRRLGGVEEGRSEGGREKGEEPEPGEAGLVEMGPVTPLAAAPPAPALSPAPARTAKAWADLAAKALERSVSPVLVQIEAAMLARGVQVAWPDGTGVQYELAEFWAVLGPEIRVRTKKPALEEACLTGVHQARGGGSGRGKGWQGSRLLTQSLPVRSSTPLAQFASLEPEGDAGVGSSCPAASPRFSAPLEPFHFAALWPASPGLSGGLAGMKLEPLAGARPLPEAQPAGLEETELAGRTRGLEEALAPELEERWEPLVVPVASTGKGRGGAGEPAGAALRPRDEPAAVTPEPVVAPMAPVAVEPHSAAASSIAGRGLPWEDILSPWSSWTPDYAPLLRESPPWPALEQSRRAPRGEAVLDKRGDEAARVPAYRPAVRQPGFTNGERETPETETAGAAAVRTIAPAALAPDWARCIPESGARLPKPGFARRRNAVRVHVGLLETGSERKAQPADGQRLAGRWKRQVA